MSASDFCELCDLPRSQCVHGRPPTAPSPVRAAPAPRRDTRRKTPTAPATPARRVTRRWTPPEVLRPAILEVLRNAGGELEAEELFLELEILVEDQLLAGDRETTPQGELRWHSAARRARQQLITDGLMSKDRPGWWTLTDAGRSGPSPAPPGQAPPGPPPPDLG